MTAASCHKAAPMILNVPLAGMDDVPGEQKRSAVPSEPENGFGNWLQDPSGALCVAPSLFCIQDIFFDFVMFLPPRSSTCVGAHHVAFAEQPEIKGGGWCHSDSQSLFIETKPLTTQEAAGGNEMAGASFPTPGSF